MQNFFISYRRKDAPDITGRIYDRLVSAFSKERVFRDLDAIPMGVDFRTHINEALKDCHLLLVVIGQKWLSITDESGEKRIEDQDDYVRLEIAAALKRKIPVIPLLVDGSEMPGEQDLPDDVKPLAFRNGRRIKADPDFHHDMNRLIAEFKETYIVQMNSEVLGKQQIRDRLYTILREQIGFDEFNEKSHLVSDLSIDALDEIEIILACEEEFNIEISSDRAEYIETPGDLLDYIYYALNPSSDLPAIMRKSHRLGPSAGIYAECGPSFSLEVGVCPIVSVLAIAQTGIFLFRTSAKTGQAVDRGALYLLGFSIFLLFVYVVYQSYLQAKNTGGDRKTTRIHGSLRLVEILRNIGLVVQKPQWIALLIAPLLLASFLLIALKFSFPISACGPLSIAYASGVVAFFAFRNSSPLPMVAVFGGAVVLGRGALQSAIGWQQMPDIAFDPNDLAQSIMMIVMGAAIVLVALLKTSSRA